MARTTETPAEGMRRCIGSTKFGLEAHDAPVADFPKQPSQKDGLGRMCRQHWTQYTRALRTGSITKVAAHPVDAPIAKKAKGATTERVVSARGISTERVVRPAPGIATEDVVVPPPTFDAEAEAELVAASLDGHDPKANAALRSARAKNVTPAEPTEDAIHTERKARVKAWRREEANRDLASGAAGPAKTEA